MKIQRGPYPFIYKNKSWLPLSIAILLIVTTLIRLHQLGYESLWMDELRQVSYYQLSIPQVVQGAAEQSQPPLDYLIGYVVHKFSNSDGAVRLPSAVFGIGMIWILTMIVARLGSWPIALMVGMISSLLPFNIYYSQEARPYSIAVFLFTTVLWFLDRSLSAKDIDLKSQGFLLISTVFFLYSRALSPLIVISVFILMLVIWAWRTAAISKGSIFSVQRNIVISIVVFILAIGLYAPSFLYVVKKSGKYLSDHTAVFKLSRLIHGLKEFDGIELWKIFVVQTEPITIPIAFLLVMAPYFMWKMRLWEKSKIYIISLFALPLLVCMHAIILKGNTDFPFRPPYAIYLLPLTIILSSVSLKGLWEITKKIKWPLFAQACYIICMIALLYMTAASAIAFKTYPIKSDWRGVSEYLNTNMDSTNLLIFKSLKPYGSPTFNGFSRYYRYKSPLISMGQIPYISMKAMKLNPEPVIILFQFREYYLTPASSYPILPVPKTYKNIYMEKIETDDFFRVKKFNGFYIIRLKEYTGCFITDAYKMIVSLVEYVPADSFKVEFYLAAAALAKAGQMPQWSYHLKQAETCSEMKHQSKMKAIGKHIRLLKVE